MCPQIQAQRQLHNPEGAADSEYTGLVIEPRIRFHVEYESITDRERCKCIRTCSFETSIDKVVVFLPNGQASFRPHWKRSLADQLISIIARHIPPGSGPEVAGPFNTACSNLRSDTFLRRRLRFSPRGLDDPSPGSELLQWIIIVASDAKKNPASLNTLHVAVIIDQDDLISLLRADNVIPFVAEDGPDTEYEEVVGSVQAMFQQCEAAFDDVVDPRSIILNGNLQKHRSESGGSSVPQIRSV